MSGYKGVKKSGYELPEDHLPENTLCVQFLIPDAPEYRRALKSHVLQLGKWFSWEKTISGDTRATEAAELWRILLLQSFVIQDTCEVDMPFLLRQNQTDLCLLEQSTDNGETWTLAFDYSLCAGRGVPLIRFDENGNMEVSYDGGQTWTPATTEDPRLTAPEFPPLPGPDGAEKRCLAARNVAGYVKVNVDQLIADSAAWGSVAGIVGVLLGLLIVIGIIGSGGALAPLMLTIAAALLGTGSAAFQAAFTSEVWQKFVCILYCNMQDDGTLSEAGLAAVKIEVDFQIGGIAGDHLINVMGLMGLIGMNNAATLPQSEFESDCSECAACSCSEGCTTTTYDVQYALNTNGSFDSYYSDGWGFRSAGSYGRVYGCKDHFTITLPEPKCIAGLQLWAGGSSDAEWPTGFNVTVDGQVFGSSNNYNPANQAFVFGSNGGAGSVVPTNPKTGSIIRFVANSLTGNQATDYGFSIKGVIIRACDVGE